MMVRFEVLTATSMKMTAHIARIEEMRKANKVLVGSLKGRDHTGGNMVRRC
jgi:hypothetical protein